MPKANLDSVKRYPQTMIILDLLEALGSPVALGLAIRIRYESCLDLPSVHPYDYNDIEAYRIDAQAKALLSKADLPYGLSSEQKAQAALDAFLESERCNLRTNLSFISYHAGEHNFMFERILHRARFIMSSILGEFNFGELKTIRFGPGATTSLRARDCHLASKVMRRPHVTPTCSHMFEKLIESTSLHSAYNECPPGGSWKVSRRSSKFATVPKDYRKDRMICVEPDGNIVTQLSLGALLTRRLASYGYVKESLPDIHRKIVRSNDRNYATIDLQNASNSISYEVVRFLFPRDWFLALSRARTPYVEIHGKEHSLEMFSAMGNGYTFELETLLFLAVTLAVEQHLNTKFRPSVFGDDIICSVEASRLLLAVLGEIGFKANPEKTFISGPFRESCGVDTWDGIDVRPIHLRTIYEAHQDPQEAYSLCNRVISISQRTYGNTDGVFCDKRFQRAHKRALDLVPLKLRFFGNTDADDALWGPFRASGKWKGFIWKQDYLGIRKRKHTVPEDRPYALLTYALMGGDSEGVSCRADKKFYRHKSRACLNHKKMIWI